MPSDKTERLEIKRMGGSPQKNSGRGQFQKGDAVLGNFIVDVKESERSFTLNRDVWGKICSDAGKHRKDPALMVCLGSGMNTVRLYVVGEEMFDQMRSAWEDKYGA